MSEPGRTRMALGRAATKIAAIPRRSGWLVGLMLVLGGAGADAMAAAQRRAPATSGPAADTMRSTALAFEGVTVIDVRTGERWPRQTVVVVGTRIHALGHVGQVAVPAGARVVKAHGTFMSPGLWDMHAHPLELGRQWYPLFVANGVTGIREMSTNVLDSVLRWRREIAAGTLVRPRVITPGPSLETPDFAAKLKSGDRLPFLLPVATPADANRIVDSLGRAGVDFIKPHGDFSREVYFALAAAARRAGLPFAGHLPKSVSPVEASDSGQRSIEHDLRCGAEAAMARDTIFDLAACQALADKFRRNGTWFSPGNPGLASICDLLEAVPSRCAELQAQHVMQSKVRKLQPNPGRRSIETWAKWHRDKDRYRPLRQAGIRFLAGTDAMALMSLEFMTAAPGSSLHDDLWRLVNSGLTPLEALQAATLHPAEYFQATDSLGTIAPGKLADFVLLDADPLVDIYNTRRVRAVVANGRFFDRGDLDALIVAGAPVP